MYKLKPLRYPAGSLGSNTQVFFTNTLDMYKLKPLRYPAGSLGSNTQVKVIFHQYS